MSTVSAPRLIVCSHRGPVSYKSVRGRAQPVRGGGGLIGVVRPVIERTGGTWIAAAMTPEDADVAARGEQDQGDFGLRFIDLPQEAHTLHYDVVCNETLWYLFHYLFDVSNAPAFGRSFTRAWDAYREVNAAYAEAVRLAGPADAVFVQDYHLMGVATRLRSRTEVPLLYFHHTPWPEPDYFGLLPWHVRREILLGLLAHDVVGFHAHRWATAFLACCDRFVPEASVASGEVGLGTRTVQVCVAPAAIDAEVVRKRAAAEPASTWLARLEEERGGRRTLVRVERIDLTKNVLRGLLAFEALLERRPELAREVWFLALGYVSRPRVTRYRRYFAMCRQIARRINVRFGDGSSSEPVRMDVNDDYDRSLAGMRLSDVLLVNPVFDGLNMVAKEGPLVNERDGVLILSRNAGVHEELGERAVSVNPFDVNETSDAIAAALDMPEHERSGRADALRELATSVTPESWARLQLGRAGL